MDAAELSGEALEFDDESAEVAGCPFAKAALQWPRRLVGVEVGA